MSKNFSQIKAAVQSWLDANSTDLPDAICGDIVNWVIKAYCRNRESRFGENTDNFATVISPNYQRDYAEPARFSKPKKLWYINPDTGSVVFLEYLNKDEFDAKYPGSVVYSTGGPYTVAGVDESTIIGDPKAYTLWAGNFLLGPVPKRVITIFRDYYEWPTDLSGASDTNKMTIAADDYLVFQSLVRASAFGIEDDRMSMWAAEAKRIEMEIDSEDARRHVTGSVSQSREPG